MSRGVKSVCNLAPSILSLSTTAFFYLLLSLSISLSSSPCLAASLPSSIPRSIHPHSNSVYITSITWVKAGPLKVTTPNCSQLRFNKSMNIYQNTCLHPESKCSFFLLSLWGHCSAVPRPLVRCFALFVTRIKSRFWHCWSSLYPLIKVSGLVLHAFFPTVH